MRRGQPRHQPARWRRPTSRPGRSPPRRPRGTKTTTGTPQNRRRIRACGVREWLQGTGSTETARVLTATQVTATLTISGAAAANYTLGAAGTTTPSTSAMAPAHITTRPISVTPVAGQSKVYGTTPDPALTYTVGGSGLATGDM